MALALEARAMADDILIGDTPKAKRRRRRLEGAETAGRLWKHSKLADVVGLVTPDEIAGMVLFTLVRNPWDRAVSYYHWLRVQSFDHPAVALARTLPFDGFLAHRETRASLGAESYGGYLRLPGRGEMPAQYVRLEHLAEDLPPVETHLGFALMPLPSVNTSERQRDYRRYYDESTARLVGELYHEDIARFGYAF